MFLSCDWGTSRFRLRLAERASGKVLAETTVDQGAARVAQEAGPDRPAAYARILGRWIQNLERLQKKDLDGLPVVVSGMASSTIGWRSLPYATLPFSLDGRGAVVEEVPSGESLPGRQVVLVSGIRAERDVLRGEESQLLGLARLPSAHDLLAGCMVVLPGTHAKHVQVEWGEVVGFRTFLTGELFELLSTHSVLRHSTGGATPLPSPLEEEARAAFQEGVREARELPLSAALFRTRAADVLEARGPLRSAAFLSGVLIGAEVSALLQAAPGSLPILLAAGSSLAEPYGLALAALGAGDRVHALSTDEADRLSVLGHAAVLDRLRGGST